ncbi:FAD-dependent monooxygenase [Burkholderia cepacia]|uniref:FAD-dependent monooxygenase n=1 Tax=Burkholderia cepacia TaxID=292 RepID=UPI001C615306|nr:FAD-dependent monooxygenase [Burkholderia cepacia]
MSQISHIADPDNSDTRPSSAALRTSVKMSSYSTALDCDVIVVGAGPAGLSVASRLARHYRVIVIDAKAAPARGNARLRAMADGSGTTNAAKIHRTWFCPHDCLYDNPELLHCRRSHGVTRFLAKTYSGPQAHNPDVFDLCWKSQLFPEVPEIDRYPYLDEYKLIAHWEQVILDSSTSSIHGGLLYQDHAVRPDHVEVRFIDRESDVPDPTVYRAKLLLDASGHDSDIRKAYTDGQSDVYWWSVFGAICLHPDGDIVDHPTPGHPLVVGDYMLWQTFASTNADPQTPVRRGRPIFEYEILDRNTSFPLILYLRPHKMSMELAKAEFLRILKQEEATQGFARAEIKEFKFGHYPSGRVQQSFAQDRVDFIGDAGLWTTPCGWGTSFILKNFAPYADSVGVLIREDRLDRKSLRRLSRGHVKRAEFLMNSIVTRFLSYGTAEQLDRFIGLFRKIDPVICERIFTLRAEPRDLLRFAAAAKGDLPISALWRSMPRRERVSIAIDIFRTLTQFAREEVSRSFGHTIERGFDVFREP